MFFYTNGFARPLISECLNYSIPNGILHSKFSRERELTLFKHAKLVSLMVDGGGPVPTNLDIKTFSSLKYPSPPDFQEVVETRDSEFRESQIVDIPPPRVGLTTPTRLR